LLRKLSGAGGPDEMTWRAGFGPRAVVCPPLI